MNPGSGALVGVVATVILVSIVARQSAGQEEPKQLDWTGRGGCVVDYVHTPCRTVRYHEYSVGSDLGFGRITNAESIEATDQTGSESKTREGTWRRWWLLPQTRFKRTELVFSAARRIVYIDHEKKVYETHQRPHNPSPYWEEDDPACSHTASLSKYLSGRLPDSTIAGIHVVGYRGRDYRGADYEIYFAPSVGCQEMSFKMVKRGFLGLVTAEYDMVVDSYVLGPPAASLFNVPAGYKQVPSILGAESEKAKTGR